MIHVSAEKTRSNTRGRGDGTLVQFALKGGMAKPALERPGTRMAIRTGLRVRMGRYPAEIARKVQWRSKIGVGIGIGIEGPGAIQHRNRSRFRSRFRFQTLIGLIGNPCLEATRKGERLFEWNLGVGAGAQCGGIPFRVNLGGFGIRG